MRAAIANAFQQVATADREKLLPLAARLKALKVPGADAVGAHLEWIEGILEMAPDDCVKTLAGEGKSYLDGRKRAAMLETLASDANLQTLETARRVLHEQWPVLTARSPGPEQEKLASDLAEMLAADNALEQLEKVRQAAQPLANGYAVLYRNTFEKRDKAYEAAIDQVKGLPEWLAFSNDTEVTNAERDLVLQPLATRLGGKLDLPSGATVCRSTRATISQMDSDIAAVEGLTRDVIRRLQQFLEPDEKIERFRVSQHFSGKISNEEELDAAMKTLREKLAKLLAQGCKVILE